MSYTTAVLSIVFGVNLLLFLAGSPEANSPILGVIKAFFFGTAADWGYVLNTLGESATIYTTLIALMVVLAYATGATPLGGGGYGVVHLGLLITAGVFTSLVLFPNFGVMGFPPMVEATIQFIFGFLVIMGFIGIFKGE